MCKFKDIVKSGLQDLKVYKKRNVVSLILMFFALVVYIGVNSHIDSVSESVADSMDALDARVCSAVVEEESLDEYLTMFKKIYGDDERIREIFQCVITTTFEWIDANDILYTDAGKVSVFGCYEAVFDYGYKGEKKIPNENEIIIPRYLCEIGIYDTKNLGDGDELIGETIKMRYETPNGAYKREFEFRVIGTYDNIKARSAGCTCYIDPQIPIDMRELRYDEEEENKEEIIQLLEEQTGEVTDYEIERNKFIGIYVKEGYDIEAVISEIYEETDGKLDFVRHRIINESLQGYFEYVLQIGNVVAVMLLVVAVINIVISSINEVKDRKWEFALKLSMGYGRKDIISIFFVEKVANLIKALVLSAFVVELYSIFITYITRNFMEYWKRAYLYTVHLDNIVVASVLIILAGLIGALIAGVMLKDINVSEELKSKD